MLPLAGVEDLAYRSFNVAPTTQVPVIVASDGSARIDMMQWGLVPAWAPDSSRSASMINARIETAMEKPSFRGLISAHRCLVPMNGFYEWDRSTSRAPLPHYVFRTDGRLLLVAGLWTRSPALDGGFSVAMLTEDSRGDLARIHHRAPVVPDDAVAVRWLTGGSGPLATLAAGARVPLGMHRVSTRVNSVRNNEESLPEKYDDGEADRDHPTLF